MERVRLEAVTSDQLAAELGWSELFIRSKFAKPTTRNTEPTRLRNMLILNAAAVSGGEHHKNIKRAILKIKSWEGVDIFMLVDDHNLTSQGEDNAPISVGDLLELYQKSMPSGKVRIPLSRDGLAAISK